MVNPRRSAAAAPLLLSVLLLLSACPRPAPCSDEEECVDAGGEVPDLCNSREEALNDPSCALTLGQARQGHVSFSGDQDWYLVQLPGGLTARSLLEVSGGYGAPSTAVNLAFNVLREDGQTSVLRGVDQHGSSAPRPIDLIVPFSESNARLLILVGDEGTQQKPPFDPRNPYTVKVEVKDNPDLNEPNDQTPTPVSLTAQGAVLVGQATGYLATANDVDRFSVVAPAGRKILYLHLTAPKLNPPPAYRLSYVLLDPAGKPVSEGQVSNEFLAPDLATARLTTAGAYTVRVQGYQSPNGPTTVPGDLRLQYTLEVRILDDLDANEPNDSLSTARVVSFSSPGGAAQTVTGRLAYVPDPDWFAVDLPASASPTVLRYRLRASNTGGRFPPLAVLADHQLRVVTQVTTGATAQDRQQACKSNDTACPKGYQTSEERNLFQSLVGSLCAASDPPLCLRAERNEDPNFAALGNFEGGLPVPAHSATARYHFIVQDDGNNYADDREYSLELRWSTDPDEAARAGLPNQTQTTTLQASASFPAPSGNELTGTLSHGYGRVLQHDWSRGQGVRAPEDYDAVPSDIDRYELVFPAMTPPEERTWVLQWELSHADGGRPYDLALEVEFCTDAGCSPKGVLAYDDRSLQAWYGPRALLWDKQETTASTTVTARPEGCFCFQSQYVRGGRFFVNVLGVDRNSYADTEYKLRMGFTDYPKSFTGDGGTTVSCPTAPTDAGGACGFAN